MRLQTVNVVEYFSDTLQAIHSFSDNETGNKEAEKLFSKIAKENRFSKKDIKAGLDNGYLDRDDYNLYIAHS